MALWITLLMICWKPFVMPLSWLRSVVWMLMSPQIRLLFHPKPTPMERMPAARPMDTALPPPIEYMTSSPMTGPLFWYPTCAHARPQTRASVPASAVGRSK